MLGYMILRFYRFVFYLYIYLFFVHATLVVRNPSVYTEVHFILYPFFFPPYVAGGECDVA